MKRVHIILIGLLLCVGALQAQQSAKEAIKYAESIDFSNTKVEIADTTPVRLCYIIPDKGVNVESGLYFPKEITITKQDTVTVYELPKEGANTKITKFDNGDKPFAINAGWWMLRVLYTDKKLSRAGKMKAANLHGRNYEEGKYYFITYDPETDAVFLKLTTDSAHVNSVKNVGKINIDEQARKRDYLAFQAANPNLLDGVWNCEKKRAMNTFYMQYSIEGDRIVFEGTNKRLPNPIVAEGRLFYNENTIIFVPEKATANGKEIKDFSSQPKYVWYYTLTDNVLHIEGGRRFGNTKGFGPVWENTGEFYK